MTTYVLMIADRSGSMGNLAGDVRGGHNAYLDQLMADGADVKISTFLFNTETTMLDEDATPAEATRLTTENYMPMGGTALHDAVGTALQRFAQTHKVKKVLDELVPEDPKDKVLVFISTDGQENASHRFTLDNVKGLIEDAENNYGWGFVFSGTAPDAWNEARGYGLSHASVSTQASSGATRARYKGYAAATSVAMSSPNPMRSADLAAEVQGEVDKADGSSK